MHESGALCAARISFGATFIFAMYDDLTDVQGAELIYLQITSILLITRKDESDLQHLLSTAWRYNWATLFLGTG
jgi:hypothetical protein